MIFYELLLFMFMRMDPHLIDHTQSFRLGLRELALYQIEWCFSILSCALNQCSHCRDWNFNVNFSSIFECDFNVVILFFFFNFRIFDLSNHLLGFFFGWFSYFNNLFVVVVVCVMEFVLYHCLVFVNSHQIALN